MSIYPKDWKPDLIPRDMMYGEICDQFKKMYKDKPHPKDVAPLKILVLYRLQQKGLEPKLVNFLLPYLDNRLQTVYSDNLSLYLWIRLRYNHYGYKYYIHVFNPILNTNIDYRVSQYLNYLPQEWRE